MVSELCITRLGPGDHELARELFAVMVAAFAEESTQLGDDYVDRLLAQGSFWALAAKLDGEVVGGLAAHVIPLTREERAELFVYDIAVAARHRRQGVGRALLGELRRLGDEAGIRVTFIAADEADADARDFYRALGGAGSGVTLFTFGES